MAAGSMAVGASAVLSGTPAAIQPRKVCGLPAVRRRRLYRPGLDSPTSGRLTFGKQRSATARRREGVANGDQQAQDQYQEEPYSDSESVQSADILQIACTQALVGRHRERKMPASAVIAHVGDPESVVMDLDRAIRSLCKLAEEPLLDGAPKVTSALLVCGTRRLGSHSGRVRLPTLRVFSSAHVLETHLISNTGSASDL